MNSKQPLQTETVRHRQHQWLELFLSEIIRQEFYLLDQSHRLAGFTLAAAEQETEPPVAISSEADGLQVRIGTSLLHPEQTVSLVDLLKLREALRSAFKLFAGLAGGAELNAPPLADSTAIPSPVDLAPLDPTPTLLERYLTAAYALLQEQAASGQLSRVFTQAFMMDASIETSQQLLSQLLAGQQLPLQVHLLDDAAIAGWAAYSPGQGSVGESIFINRQWLASAPAEQVLAVFLEELGHAFEQRLRQGSDTEGDEGRRFAELLLGADLDQLLPGRAAATADDHGVVLFNGETIAVEYATAANTNLSYTENSNSYSDLFTEATGTSTWASSSSFGIRVVNYNPDDWLVFDLNGLNITSDTSIIKNSSLEPLSRYVFINLNSGLSGAISSTQLAAANLNSISNVAWTTGIISSATSPTLNIQFTITSSSTSQNVTLKNSVAHSLAFYSKSEDPTALSDTRQVQFWNVKSTLLNPGSTVARRIANLTITGVNDLVVITSTAQNGAVTEDDAEANFATGSVIFTDLDLTDLHIASFTGTAQYGSFKLANITANTNGTGGSQSWSYTLDNTNTAVQALGVGEILTETFSITVDDSNGGAASQNVTITITGAIDFNNVDYNFTGGNTSWAGFVPAGEALGSFPVDNDSLDLLLTPAINSANSGTVNTTATIGGISGGASVGSGETFRVDFVKDLSGDPSDTVGGQNYASSLNRDHFFDGHYVVNGASALFKSSNNSTIKITAFDDPDNNTVVGDGFKDMISGITISYFGVAGGLVIPTSAATSYIVNGHVFTVILNLDGSVSVGGVAGDPGSSLKGTVITAFTANGYNSIEYTHQAGDTFQIGNFGAIVRSTEPVSVTAPVQVINADGDISASSNLVITAIAPPATAQKPPIALDGINDSAITYQALATSNAYFDYACDGFAEQIAWIAAGDALLVYDHNHNKIGGLTTDVFSLSDNPVSRRFSAELSGILPGIGGADPITGHFLLRSSTINSFSRSSNNSSANIHGTADLLRLVRTVDPITGAYISNGTGDPVATGLSFRVRLRDHDLASQEALNGIYDEQSESRTTANANGSLIDEAELVVFQPGGTNILFSTDGFNPIKSTTFSPLVVSDPLHHYQPNVWL